MIKCIKNNLGLLWDLSKNDFKTKYVGSNFGIVWAVVQPLITIIVYWLVFEFGLRMGSTASDNKPYILWFMTGLVPWFFFTEALSSGTNCLFEYNYLVKKVIFPIKLLPLIKLISALFVHFVFVIFLVGVYAVYGYVGDIHPIRLLYFMVCMAFFTIGLIYICAAIIVFFKDLGQIINVVLQVGMWATPILWNYKGTVPDSLLWIFKLNPMFYIVEGYRDSMLYDVSLFANWKQMLYVWGIICLFMFFGIKLFAKLETHFADVL